MSPPTSEDPASGPRGVVLFLAAGPEAEGLATRLERDGEFEVVLRSRPGEDLHRKDAFDCVLVEARFGTDVVESLGGTRSGPPIVVVARDDDPDASEMFDAGADDYVRLDPGDDVTLLVARIGANAERYRAVRERTHLQKWYRTTVESSTDAIVVVDEEGTIQYTTSPTGSVIGCDPDSLTGKSIVEEARPDGRDRIQKLLARVSDGGEPPLTAEVQVRDGRDEWRWVEITGSDPEDVQGYVLTLRDVTEPRERERELERQNERLRTIIDNVPMVLYVLDPDGEITLSKGRGLDRLDLDPGEVVGTSVFDLYEDHTKIREHARRALAGEQGHTVVGIGDRCFESWYEPVVEDGEIERVVGVSMDVTERERRKRELERQNERLDRFASLVSHDLRNPLEVANAGVELARHDPEHVDHVADALDRMESIIDDLLALTRGDGVTTEPVALGDLAEECWDGVPTDGVRLDVADPPVVEADVSKLRSLLENLFRNAAEHAGEGTTVRVGGTENGFYVSDDGPGIPDSERRAVFDPGRSSSDGGSGFGLFIVREVAESHDWGVDATESSEGGTRFEVTGITIPESR